MQNKSLTKKQIHDKQLNAPNQVKSRKFSWCNFRPGRRRTSKQFNRGKGDTGCGAMVRNCGKV